MISNNIKEIITTQFRIKKFLWLGLTIGIILYFLAVYFITLNAEHNDNFSRKAENTIFYIGIIFLIASIFLRRYMLSHNFFQNLLFTEKPTGKHPEFPLYNKETNYSNTNLSNLEKGIKNYLSKYQVYYIVNLGLNDSIGILGIAVGFISRDITKAVPYMLVAFLLNIWIYPRQERLISKMESLKNYD